MGCQSLTEIDMNKEYKYFSTKMKIRAYKSRARRFYKMEQLFRRKICLRKQF